MQTNASPPITNSGLVFQEYAWTSQAALKAVLQAADTQRMTDEFARRHIASDDNRVESYKGSLSVVTFFFLESPVYPNIHAANVFITANLKREGTALAVPALKRRVFDHRLAEADAKYCALSQATQEVGAELFHLDRSIHERVKAGKNPFRCCSQCDSRINVAHMREATTRCPVCADNLMKTLADEKKEVALRARVELLRKERDSRLEALMRKANPDQPVDEKVWVVGQWW